MKPVVSPLTKFDPVYLELGSDPSASQFPHKSQRLENYEKNAY
jgi:hypothetical protein